MTDAVDVMMAWVQAMRGEYDIKDPQGRRMMLAALAERYPSDYRSRDARVKADLMLRKMAGT